MLCEQKLMIARDASLPTWHGRSRRLASVSRGDRLVWPRKCDLYPGSPFHGSRLNKLYRQDTGHDEIVAPLTPLIEPYAKDRAAGERFGDFVIRKGYVARTASGRDFHANLSAELAA
jgi:sulfite reductase beta subunit-like hemoprotein